jgi:hypothetical protein
MEHLKGGVWWLPRTKGREDDNMLQSDEENMLSKVMDV